MRKINLKEIKKSDTFRLVKLMLQIAAKNKPIFFVVYLLRFLATILDKVKIVLLPKFIIDELMLIFNSSQNSGTDIFDHLRNAAIFAIITVATQFLVSLLNQIAGSINSSCSEYFNEYFDIQLSDFSMSIDYELTEDPEILDQKNRAKEGMAWYSHNVPGILDPIFDIASSLVILIGLIVLMAKTAPILIPIQFVSALISYLFQKKIMKIELESFSQQAKLNRVFGYVFFEISDFSYGKDIRLYDSAELFTQKQEEINRAQNKVWMRQSKGVRTQSNKDALVTVIFNFLNYFYIGYLAVKRLISVGDFSMCISSVSELQGAINQIMSLYLRFNQNANYAKEYLKYLDCPKDLALKAKKGSRKILPSQNHEIEFKDVSFKYPRSENFVLQNLNLKIPAGQHLALVGLNGEGKTTLIKLLCRLYQVTQGQILVGGVNINEYDEEEYKKLFAVLFQDFNIFAFSVRENVAFEEGDFGESDEKMNASKSKVSTTGENSTAGLQNGHPGVPSSGREKIPAGVPISGEVQKSAQSAIDEKVDSALKKAGIYDFIQTLPYKNATPINKNFDEKGTEFSGGQKQKVGIARAIYKDAPIVILDEPTAALDPLAEAEIYEKFNENLANGKTALYISHRLSSCKFCDKIAVFSEKQVKEYGSHAELMENPAGLYYKMFTTQTQNYQKDDSSSLS